MLKAGNYYSLILILFNHTSQFEALFVSTSIIIFIRSLINMNYYSGLTADYKYANIALSSFLIHNRNYIFLELLKIASHDMVCA